MPYYDRAGITIYHGDAAEVLASLDVVVNLVVTSPPYNQMGSVTKKPSGMWADRAGGLLVFVLTITTVRGMLEA